MNARILWLVAVALATLGTALVFGAVTIAGLFQPGVILIVVGAVAAAAAGVMAALRART